MSKAKSARTWYTLRAQTEDAYELLLYGDIGRNWWGDGIAAQELVEELNDIEAATIDVRINSYGGIVFEGLAIANALMRHEARIVTHVDGIAASIASIIALAGEDVRMAENAFLMVHNAWGLVIGNAREMREVADVLDKIDGSLAQTYAQKARTDLETARAWMEAETWFTSAEASELGLVDAIENARELDEDDEDVEASVQRYDLSAFRHVPEQVAARFGGGERGAPHDIVVTDELLANAEQLVEAFRAASGAGPWTCSRKPAAARVTPAAAGPRPELLELMAESFRVLDATRL